MSKTFWPTQPVGVGEGEGGIIYEPREKNNEQTPLPSGFRWQFIEDVNQIVEFLKFNYVSNVDDGLSLSYSQNIFGRLFELPNHHKEYSLGMVMEGSIVGYIFAKEHRLVIDGREELVISINFLCLRKTHRNMALAPILISEIKRLAFNRGIYRAIFTNSENRGFGFTEAIYYHLPINIDKLKRMIYIPRSCSHIEYTMRSSTRPPHGSDFDRIFDLFKSDLRNYSIYEDFSREELEMTLTEIEDTIYTIYNEETNEYASFFIIETFCWESMEPIKKAYLYYWKGSELILRDLFALAQMKGVDMFDVLNIARNEVDVIERFGFLEGSGRIMYHLFNWKQPLRARSKTNFILF